MPEPFGLMLNVKVSFESVPLSVSISMKVLPLTDPAFALVINQLFTAGKSGPVIESVPPLPSIPGVPVKLAPATKVKLSVLPPVPPSNNAKSINSVVFPLVVIVPSLMPFESAPKSSMLHVLVVPEPEAPCNVLVRLALPT